MMTAFKKIGVYLSEKCVKSTSWVKPTFWALGTLMKKGNEEIVYVHIK